MTKRLVSFDDETGRLPDDVEGRLTASIARADRLDPAFAALDFSIRNGLSDGMWSSGDSTGDSPGTGVNVHLFEGFARRVAAATTQHCVLYKSVDWNTGKWRPWVNLTPGKTQRWAKSNGRSLRYRDPDHLTKTRFTTGNIDITLRSQGATLGAEQIIAAANNSDDDDFGTVFQFAFGITADNHPFVRIGGGTGWDTRVCDTALASVPEFLRFTNVNAPDPGATGHREVKWLTSPDGVTWTQFGSTSSYTGGLLPIYDTARPYITIGADGWSPVGAPFSGRILEVYIRDGVDGQLVAPVNPESYERFGDSATTIGGDPTLYFTNASRGGSKMSAHTSAAALALEVEDFGQSVAAFNDSHNEGDLTGTEWTKQYAAWVAAVQARLRRATPVAVLQNPHTSEWPNEAAYGREHVTRLQQLSALATRNGWGQVDIYSAFMDDPRGLSVLIQAGDGLHPSEVGYELGYDTFSRRALIPTS